MAPISSRSQRLMHFDRREKLLPHLAAPRRECLHLIGNELPQFFIDQISVRIESAGKCVGIDFGFIQRAKVEEYANLPQVILCT